MRNTLIAVAATAGFLTMGTLGASAAPVSDIVQAKLVEGRSAAIVKADWYCGPRCQYWRHQRWEQRHRWHDYRYGYNGHNGRNGYQAYRGGYGYQYR